MADKWWEQDPIASGDTPGDEWWAADPIVKERKKRKSEATAGDYLRAVDSGLAQGVAGISGGIGTFIQDPAANMLAGVSGAAAAADRGVTWATNAISGKDIAKENEAIQENARTASRFAAESRDAQAADPTNLPARFGRMLQRDSERANAEIAAADRARNPELLAQQQNTAEAEGFLDNLAAIKDNPLAFTHTMARSLPDMAAGVGVGSVVHRAGAGMGRVSTAGALSEASSSALQSRQGVYQQVQEMPIELLDKSPRFQAVVAETQGDKTKAREILANELADQVPLLAGAGTALGTVLTNKLFGGDATAKTIAGVDKMGVREFGKRVAQDTLEEGFQGVPEDAVQYGATVQANPAQQYDPGGSAAQNLAAGLAMGAGGHSLGYARDNFRRGNVENQTPAENQQNQAPALSGQAQAATNSGAAAGVVAGRGSAGLEAVGVGDTAAAEEALKTPVQLTALDRADALGGELQAITERQQELAPENGYGPAFDGERQDLATKAAELAAERDSIAATWPKAERGAMSSFTTEAGARLDAQYALMDAGDLVTSHDEGLAVNPLFPKELQPRDRSRQASELQVSGIVQRLDPARLGLSADAANGAPIVGADGLVESGNARTIALKRVYQANGQKAENYKQFLRDNAAQFGLAPEAIDAMAKPVLVRVRATPVNRAEFARQANASTVQRMSPSEQALSDAKRLNSLDGLNPDEQGDFGNNMDFVRQFMATLPVTEQSDLIESDGRLSTAGYRRIQNAVLARAYGDSPSLRRMTESMDNNLANISKALVRVAPTIAAARERMDAGTLHQADIAPDLLAAVEGLSALKEKGWKVADELGQADLTGPKYSPEAAELLTFLSDNARSPRRIAEFFQRYYDALEHAGDPTQPSMFGDDGPAPTRASLINTAKETQNGNADQDPERGIAGEGAQADARDGSQPQDAPRSEGRDQGDGPAQADAAGRQPGKPAREAANDEVGEPKDAGKSRLSRAALPAKPEPADPPAPPVKAGDTVTWEIKGKTVVGEVVRAPGRDGAATVRATSAEAGAGAKAGGVFSVQAGKLKALQKVEQSAPDDKALESDLANENEGTEERNTEERVQAPNLSRGRNKSMATNDVVGNQGGRSADDSTTGASDAQAVDENTGLPLNADGTVTVYHHTSEASADLIRKSGRLKADAEPDVYVTTRKETDTGYGDSAVALRVRPDQLSIDDEFPDGRKDFRMTVGRPGGSIEVAVENEPSASVHPDANEADIRLSRSPATETAYEARIDALFAGAEAGRQGVRVLDRSDVLGLLGHPDQPVILAEGKVLQGQDNHQRMTAKMWKSVPEWIESPSAVFASDTVPGRLVFIAPEMVNGSPVRMIVEPDTKVGGLKVHLLVNAFDAAGRTPWMRWAVDGLAKYIDKKKFPAILAPSGLQLSRVEQASRGTAKILTEKQLAGYRKARGDTMLSFAGARATGADLGKLAQAKDMAQRGTASAEIQTQTGWHKGIDGRWRFEISDDKAKFKTVTVSQEQKEAIRAGVERDAEVTPDDGLFRAVIGDGTANVMTAYASTERRALDNLASRVTRARYGVQFDIEAVRDRDAVPLPSVLDHPDLMAAYPFLGGYTVYFRKDGIAADRGSLDESAQAITLNANRAPDEMLSTLLHEVQHAIQGREDFARGGNSDAAFTASVRNVLSQMAEGEARKVEQWKQDNPDKMSDAERTAAVARDAVKFEAAERLLAYSEREAPSGVFRLIRNEMQWLYGQEYRDNQVAQDLLRKFYGIPKRGDKRNQHIGDMAFEAQRIIRASIPTDRLVAFKADERTTKGLIAAMRRQADKANAQLQPLREQEARARTAETLADNSKYKGAFEIYRALAGEVEARASQARQSLTTEERRNRPVQADMDISPAEVIVVVGGNEMLVPESQMDARQWQAFSRSTRVATQTGMPVDELQALATDIARKNPRMPKVNVLADPSKAPKALRDYIEEQGAWDDVDGAMHDGELYLFASGLPDALRAEHVLAEHEAAHFGLRAILGDSLPQAMELIYANNGAVRRAATAMQRRGKLSNAAAVEEIIVDMPNAQLVQLKGWRKVTALARDWLAAHGFTEMSEKLSTWLDGTLTDQQRADLFVADLVRGARAYVAGKGKESTGAKVAGTRLSATLADDMARQEKWLTGEARGRGFKDIEDLLHKNYPAFEKLAELWRRKHPGEALLSRGGAGDQTQTEAFKKWFGDSKVVDADGKPLVVYHGTSGNQGGEAFTSFDTYASNYGLMGMGGYFTADQAVASSYTTKGKGSTPTVYPAYLTIKNPLDMNADTDGAAWTNQFPDALEFHEGGATNESWYRAAEEALANEEIPSYEGAEIMQDGLRAMGYDGITHMGGGRIKSDSVKHRVYIAFDPEQIKSATGNSGAFDPSSPDIRLSRAAPSQDAAARAEAIIQDKTGGARPLDAMAHMLTRATGVERLTGAIYDKAANLLAAIVPEKIKAGVMSDYGLPEAVKDQRTMLQGRQRVQLRKAGSLIEKLATLTRAESRVAYEWMNMDGADPQAYVSMMQGLPEESVAVLQEVQTMIDRLSKDAVRLGQLDPEAFKRNRFAYLRRSYAKHTLEQTKGQKAKRARTIAVLGEQYKGRGLSETAAMSAIKNIAPEWWERKLRKGKADTALKGEQLLRLERRAPSGTGTTPLPGMTGRQPGRVLELAYWPASERLPAKYADWTQAGTWEVRDVKGPNAVLWRDFTKDEREQMGEIDEARFAIAKTLHAMIHDVEVGRYLDWLAINQAKKEGEAIPGEVVDASEKYRDTFAPGEWVRVPDSKIAGTNVLKYGKLAGRYVEGPVWNDLRQMAGGGFQPFGDTYNKVLNLWKMSKTALSPAVHMNNVMSNFVMADWHEVHAAHVSKALRIMLAASDKRGGIADRDAAREILNRYSDSGGDSGSWVTNEISRDQIEPLLKSLELEMAQTNGGNSETHTGVYAALQHALQLRFPETLDAAVSSVPGKIVKKVGGTLLDAYQAEDDVFRLGAWLAAKEQGATDLDAGKRAKNSFLDYSINAPWISAMRKSFWPFFSFTYRAVPMLLETAARKPHKLLKLMAIAGGLNALGTMLAGGGDDDKDRKLLPEEKSGGIWGAVPKLIRMPWNDGHNSPVYLDIRRFVPVGDVVDVNQGQSALPIPPGLQPGGPLVILGELIINKSAFTGKSITQGTDTAGEKIEKILDHLYKAAAPNILGLPGTYATTGVWEAMHGKTDKFGREMSVPQAVASSFGVKLGSYPADVMRKNLIGKFKSEKMELDMNIGQLKRQYQTKRIGEEEFRSKVQAQQDKQRKLQQELNEKLN